MEIPWFAWIVIVAIVCGVTVEIVKLALRSREKRAEFSGGSELRGILEQSNASNQRVAEKLDGLETRLAAMEKTLTDIP